MSGRSSISLLLLLLLSVVGSAVYLPGMRIPYYADDFQFVFSPPFPGLLHYFTSPLTDNGFYRPLQAAYLIAVQRLFGLNTVPVHVLQLILHVLLSFLVYEAVKRAGFSLVQAALASFFMLLSQANVHAVLSNDTLSQVGATFFGFLALRSAAGCLFSGEEGEGGSKGLVPAAAFSLAVALFFKETALSFLVLILALAALRGSRRAMTWLRAADGPAGTGAVDRGTAKRRILALVVPVLVVAAGYVLARSMVVPTRPALGAGKYDFHAGVNVARNTVMFAVASVVPFSTVKLLGALRNAGAGAAIGMLGATFILVAVVFRGLHGSGKGRAAALIAGFALLSLFPMILMNHVSELYVYNAMPFVSALFGIGLGGCVAGFERRRLGAVAAGTIAVAALLGNMLAVRSKAALMQEAGTRATELVAEIIPFVDAIPEGGKLVLLNPPGEAARYSIFVVPGFDCLRDGLGRLGSLSGREDLAVEIWDKSLARRRRAGEKDLVLTIEKGDVVRIRRR